MKKVLSLLILLAGVTSRADLLQYNISGTSSVVGDGLAGTVSPIRGLMVFDTETTNFTQVISLPNKTFAVGSSSNEYQVVQLSAPHGVTHTVIAGCLSTNINGSLFMDSEFIKGRNQTLITGANRTVFFPSVLTMSRARAIEPGPHGGNMYVEISFTYAYNKNATITDNNALKTRSQIVTSFVNSLKGKGYHQSSN